jgi:hypothetical protein
MSTQRRDLLLETEVSEVVTGAAMLVSKVPYAVSKGMEAFGEEGVASSPVVGAFERGEDIPRADNQG